MRKFILLWIMIFPAFAFSQKVLWDKIDAFTNERVLTTSVVSLKSIAFTPILQAGVVAKVISKDSIVNFDINFTIANYAGDARTSDTVFNCLLKLSSGEIITGKFSNESVMYMLTMGIKRTISYRFNSIDFNKLANNKVIAIRAKAKSGNGIEMELNNSEKIMDCCKAIIKKLSK